MTPAEKLERNRLRRLARRIQARALRAAIRANQEAQQNRPWY
jgi:hypothetical protein